MGAIVGYTGPPDPALTRAMQAALSHRGDGRWQQHEWPGGCIAWVAPANGLPPDWTRAGLSTHADSALAIAGQLTTPRPDLTVPALLPCNSLASLRGAWVAAWRHGDAIHLARDGAGARTLYYAEHAGRLLFAVEPKAILAVPGFPRRLRPAAVAQYLTFSFIPGRDTMLEGLYELPAGHSLTWDGARLGPLQRWFRFEDAGVVHRDRASLVAEARDICRQAVADRLPPGDEPIGLFLSGGIDSSVVAVDLAEQRRAHTQTYAIHFGPDYAHELDFARAVAERLDLPYREVEIRPQDFLPRLREMVWRLDEPIGDPITMPNYELARIVAQDTRIAFNGEGGDPLFGGPKNLTMMMHHWYGGVPRDPLYRERAYLESYRRAGRDMEGLLTPEFRAQIDSEAALEGLLTPYLDCARPEALLDRLMAINLRLKGAHLILPKVERLYNAAGLTPMSPLFDDRLVEFAFRLPPTLKVHRGIEKVILKEAYAPHLPLSVIERPKSGMRVPVHYWLRGEMHTYARKVLHPKAIRRAGIFDPKRVAAYLKYADGERLGRHGLRLWMLLTFEIWRRIVIDGEAP